MVTLELSNGIAWFWNIPCTFHANQCPSSVHLRRFASTAPARGARPQIVLFLTHVYDTKMNFKKLFDKRFRRIFSSAFQWRRQFFRNFPFWPSKTLSHSISNKKHFGHSFGNILSYVENAQLSIYRVKKNIKNTLFDMFCTFWRWKWKILEKLLTSLESWGKNTSKTFIKQFF